MNKVDGIHIDVLTSYASDAVRFTDAVLSMCPQWDRLHLIFSDFPHLTPLSASSSEIHPNDDAEEEGSITESVEPTQTPRRQVLNYFQVLNSDAQKKPLPIMANHSPGKTGRQENSQYNLIYVKRKSLVYELFLQECFSRWTGIVFRKSHLILVKLQCSW